MFISLFEREGRKKLVWYIKAFSKQAWYIRIWPFRMAETFTGCYLRILEQKKVAVETAT